MGRPARRPCRRLRGAALLYSALTLFSFGRATAADVAEGPEEKVKGEFIQRFPLFVDWPAGTFADGSRFVVCVAGESAVADYVLAAAQHRRWKDREAVGVRLQRGAPPTRCHLLFLALSDGPWLAELLKASAGRPVLTVGDAPGLAARGALINLFREGEHIRFEVNVDLAGQSPLKFQAQFLEIARPVHSAAR